MKLECPICLSSLFEPVGINQTLVETPDPDGPSTSSSISSRGRLSLIRYTAGGGRAGRGRPRKAKLAPAPKSQIQLSAETSVTPCGHLFHSQCLQNWIAETGGSPTCPNCRKKFGKTKITQVFLDYGISNSSLTGSSSGIGRPSVPPNDADDTSDDELDIVEVASSSSASTTTTGRNVGDRDATPYNGTDLNDLKFIHGTLIADFNELRTKCADLEDEVELREGFIKSLEEHKLRLEEELRKYKVDSPSPGPTKRKPAKSSGSGPPGKRRRN